MKRSILALSTLAAIWACGETDPENAAPEVCGDPVPDQTVAVGESAQVQACFEDPDGDSITLMAASSDEGIVRPALPWKQRVDVFGITVGKATITVTASDPDGLEAKMSFGVEVPNRPPEATTPLPDLNLMEGEVAFFDLGDHFEDPDGQDLSYDTGSSDSLVALSAVEGDTLFVGGLLLGEATVTVTATDPGDLTVSQNIDVQVSGHGPQIIFNHTFTDSVEIDDWEPQAYADLLIIFDRLVIHNDSAHRAWAYRDLGFEPGDELSPHVDFIADADYRDGAEIAVHMRQEGLEYLSFGFGDSIPFDRGTEEGDTVWVDYVFSWYPSEAWRTHEDLWGRSDLIPDPGDGGAIIRFVLDGTNILIEIDDQTLLEFDLADYTDTEPDNVRGAILGTWPRKGTGHPAVFEFATLIHYEK